MRQILDSVFRRCMVNVTSANEEYHRNDEKEEDDDEENGYDDGEVTMKMKVTNYSHYLSRNN